MNNSTYCSGEMAASSSLVFGNPSDKKHGEHVGSHMSPHNNAHTPKRELRGKAGGGEPLDFSVLSSNKTILM